MLDSYFESSYDLLLLGDNRYSLLASQEHKKDGNLAEIITFMVVKYNFKITEIETAVLEMHQKDHVRAHFGVKKTLIFTSNMERAS